MPEKNRMRLAKSIDWTGAGHALIRLLIVSYIAGAAIGLTPGPDFFRLGAAILGEAHSTIVVNGLVIILTAMVLGDILRRGAALTLSLILFWASYLTLFATDATSVEVAGFWRDLALIGGLLAVVRDREPIYESDWDWDYYDEDYDDDLEDDEDFEDELDILSHPRQADTAQASAEDSTDSKFREDLKVARAS